MVAINEKPFERRHIDHKDYPGTFKVFTVFTSKRALAVGRAFVLYQDGEALLIDIQVEKDYRNKGYGKNMIFAMQQIFDSIVTAWYSNAGKNLCLSCGFKAENSGKVPKLIWVKESEKDAGEKDNSSHQE